MRGMEQTLLLPTDTAVTCPKCEHGFSLEQGFARKALESLEASSAQSLAAVREQERAAVEKRARELASERERAAQQQAEELRKLMAEQAASHERSLAEVRKLTEQAVRPQLDALKSQLADSQIKLSQMDQREAALAAREKSIESRVAEAASTRAAEMVASERESWEKQLAAQSAQVSQLRAEQVALREERQKLKDEKEALALEVQKQVDHLVAQREAAVRAQETDRAKLREAELQKKLDDLSSQLADAQRKAEQGSQQLQGEVLELAIEEGLRRSFPVDVIEEVKKGQRGGDVIQRVTSRSGQIAGVVLWETKRAKDWSAQWATKLKEDMRAAGADVGVLVTMPTAVPKEWAPGQQFGLHEDIWVSTWSTALQLAEVLRSAVLDVHKQRLVSAGKGEKMEAVYDYVTSPQFAQKLRAVYDTFQKMRDELESERNTTQQRWARREKQLQAGVASLLGIGGEIQGLAQDSVPGLELQTEPGSASET
jgi:hypothetical protein